MIFMYDICQTFSFKMAIEWKKKLAVFLVISGIVLILIGVFVGRRIIQSVHDNVAKKNCVTSKTDESFRQWSAKSVRKTSVTFWHILNKEEFLYQRKLPKLEEKGPYIYTTTGTKIDINFDKDTVSFKEYKTQVFDAELTHEKCPSCNENDKVTILNTAYMGLIAQFKGDRAFSLFMIPNIVKAYLEQLQVKISDKKSAYTYLGNHKVTVDKRGVPAFGPWLGENSSFVASIINGTRAGKSYNWTEMEALYNVLTNASLLLPPQTSNTTDPTVKERGLVTYLGAYAALAKTNTTISNATIKATKMQKLQARMNELLCPNRNSSTCFQVNDAITIQALTLFVTSYLAATSFNFLDENNYGLIVSRPVKELVLGYTMTKLPLPPKYPNGIPVPGVLENHASESVARNKSKVVSLYTCGSTLGAPYTWAGYDGKTMVPQSYFPNAMPEQLKIAGYHTSQFTATRKLSTCKNTYPATAPHFDIFVGAIFQQLRLKYQTSQTIHGVHLNRYILDEDIMKTNNRTIFMDGIIDVSNIRGIPVSISAPGFLYCHSSLYKQLSMVEPEVETYGTTIDIEPVTGKPMNVMFRVQINSLITKEIISTERHRPLNMTFYETEKPYTKHFPLFWTEDGGKLTKKGASYLQDELFSYFSVSCTITVVLPVIGSLVLIAGIILVLLIVKTSSTGNAVSGERN